MPHISIEYSANVADWTELTEFCHQLRLAAVETGLFAPEGVRVRTVRCEHYSIADGSPARGFVDISVRLRGGRSIEARKKAAEMIFAAAKLYLEPVLAARPFALSLEMRDIDPELSPKISTLRQYLEAD